MNVFEKCPNRGVIKAGSGRLLKYSFYRGENDSMLKISDFLRGQYRLDFTLDIETKSIEFSLYTKLNKQDQPEFANASKHPDLYASRFIEAVLCCCCERGWQIDQVKSYWVKDRSDDFPIFEEDYKKHNDSAHAARKTSSASRWARYGFTEIDSKKIKVIKNNSGLPVSVTAIFSKPSLIQG